jgi:RND superfamily putative drug exporter
VPRAIIGHSEGLNFILPFLRFLFLLALGEDDNILVMTRIREEPQRLPLDEAVTKALAATGTTVTSAGLVLAGAFAVFAVAGGSSQIQQIGLGIAVGVLMDTFLMRTLLVPSTVVLSAAGTGGRRSWSASRNRKPRKTDRCRSVRSDRGRPGGPRKAGPPGPGPSHSRAGSYFGLGQDVVHSRRGRGAGHRGFPIPMGEGEAAPPSFW